MADTWLTIEQAAVALRLSVRTVNRHIHAQKIQSRLNDGRREVLVRIAGEDEDQVETEVDSQQAGSRQDVETTQQRGVASAISTTANSFKAEDPSDEMRADLYSEHQGTGRTFNPSDTSSTARDHTLTNDERAFESRDGNATTSGPDNISLPMSAAAHSLDQRHARRFAVDDADAQLLRGDLSQDANKQAEVESSDSDEGSPLDSQPSGGAHSSVNSVAASSVDVETVLTLADQAADKADVAIVAYQTLARVADTQVRSLRRSARMAWVLVATMTVAVMTAGWWVTQRITASEIHLNGLQQQAKYHEQRATSSAAEAERLAAERDTYGQQASKAREEAAFAREQQARLEGKLTAVTEANKRPTTRPGLVGRLTSIFGGQP